MKATTYGGALKLVLEFGEARAGTVKSIVMVTFALLLGVGANGKDWYVSSTAGTNGAGTRGNPWSMATAFAHPAEVSPGDTIWVRGGRYMGLYVSKLNGTATAPIVVRQMPGERATLDGKGFTSQSAVLGVMGNHTWFWGFELTNSDTDRISAEAGSGPSMIEMPRRNGLEIFQSVPVNSGVKFINLQVHDHRQGFSLWKNSRDVEVYGCLIYYNGWDGPDRAHGHGIYLQNETGEKAIRDCVIFCQFDTGIHAYGSSVAPLDNITCQRNIVFGNGLLYRGLPEKQILLGGGRPAHNARVESNWTYARSGLLFRLGYETGSVDAVVSSNYFARDGYVIFTTPTNLVLRDNMIATRLLYGIETNAYPGNKFLSDPPETFVSALYPNKYETNRANLVVYNWNQRPTVEVDVSSFIGNGEVYEIRNCMDYFRDVHLGTNLTGRLNIDMVNRTVAEPYGRMAPTGIFPSFGAFVLQRLGPPPEAIEAENARLGNGILVATNVVASEGRFVTFGTSNGSELNLDVRVPSEGEYYAWLRIQVSAATGALFDVSMDGDPEEALWLPSGVTVGAWNWVLLNRLAIGEAAEVKPRPLEMAPGTHTVRFRSKTAGVGLDQVMLTRDPTYRPPHRPEALRVLER